MKERSFYDEADFQKIKTLRKDTEETSDRLEEIITHLEGVYMRKGKRSKELKAIKDYYIIITERRAEVIRLSKEATKVVETSRNAVKEAKDRERREDNSGRREGEGRGGDRIRTVQRSKNLHQETYISSLFKGIPGVQNRKGWTRGQ